MRISEKPPQTFKADKLINKNQVGGRSAGVAPGIVLLLTITALISLYYVLRYAGHWAETDTSILGSAIRNLIQAGQLVPANGMTYSYGYTYQAIAAFVMAATGIDVVTLQQLVFPFAIILLAVPTWMLLYEITGSQRSAVLGSILLFTQPEFLFVVLRGSHEKFGRLFMILALFFLFRSFKSLGKLGLFATYMSLFYLVMYALLASNFLIGFSFISAMTFALVAGAALASFRFTATDTDTTRSTTRRMILVVTACFILAFLLIFYFYPPAQNSLILIISILDKTKALMLGTETSTNIYQGMLNGWINPGVYVLINISNWLILLISFPIWVWQGYHWVILKQSPKGNATWLLWLLYGAFGFQAMLSIISDSTGFLGNLQYRLFPSFVLMAVAIVADTLSSYNFRFQKNNFVKVSMGVAVFILACLSMIKATNEFSLVNWWTFYTTPELHAIQWFDNNNNNSTLWVGYSERLKTALQLIQDGPKSDNHLLIVLNPDISNYLLSDLITQQSLRVHIPLPELNSMQQIYDNGSSQLYHRRSVTPYMR